MPLNETQRVHAEKFIRAASDAYVRRPLWDMHPYYRPLLLTERKRRNILQNDPEPSGDSEYS